MSSSFKLNFLKVVACISWVLFFWGVSNSLIVVMYPVDKNDLVKIDGSLKTFKCLQSIKSQSSFEFEISGLSHDAAKLFVIPGNCEQKESFSKKGMKAEVWINPEDNMVWALTLGDRTIFSYSDRRYRGLITLIFGGLILGAVAIAMTMLYKREWKKQKKQQ